MSAIGAAAGLALIAIGLLAAVVYLRDRARALALIDRAQTVVGSGPRYIKPEAYERALLDLEQAAQLRAGSSIAPRLLADALLKRADLLATVDPAGALADLDRAEVAWPEIDTLELRARLQREGGRLLASGLVLESPQPGAIVDGDAPLTLRGRVGAATTRLEIGGTPVELTDGCFRYQVHALADGAQELSIRLFGNTGECHEEKLPILVDRLAPLLTIDAPEYGSWNTARCEVRGTVKDASPCRLELRGDDGAALATGSSGADGSFSLIAVLPDGRAAVTLTATDAVGHRVQRDLQLRVDDTPPELRVPASAEVILTNAHSLPIEGTIVDTGSGVPHVTLDGREVAIGADNRLRASLSLPGDGEHRFAIVAADRAGNSTQVELQVRVDRRAPVIRIDSPQDGQEVPTGALRLAGGCQDDTPCQVEVANDRVAAAAGGRFEIVVHCEQPGEQRLRVLATDAAGNPATRELTLIAQPRCTDCDGSMRCASCAGNGIAECTDCDGGGTRNQRCATCDATGKATCSTCNGKARVNQPCDTCNSTGHTTCLTCGGQRPYYDTCPECRGTGWTSRERERPAQPGELNSKPCDTCRGYRVPGKVPKPSCPTCSGRLTFPCTTCRASRVACGTCNGTGHTGDCDDCEDGRRTSRCTTCAGGTASVGCPACDGDGRCRPCQGLGFKRVGN